MNKIIFIYSKESPKGLKYLGVTTKDPFKYMGSGKYWKNHLKLNKYSSTDIKTLILYQSLNREDIKIMGLFYSQWFNIVEDKLWANLIPESGELSVLGLRHSEVTKEKIRKIKVEESLITRPIQTIYKYSLNGDFLEKISNIRRYCINNNIKDSNINKCAKGEKSTAYNFIWSYEKKEFVKPQLKWKHPDDKTRYILQFSLDGELIREFNSFKEVPDEFSQSKISLCCSNKRKTHKGFIWKYKI